MEEARQHSVVASNGSSDGSWRGTNWSVVVAAIAVVVASLQAWMSFEVLSDGRHALLASRRIDACGELIADAYRALDAVPAVIGHLRRDTRDLDRWTAVTTVLREPIVEFADDKRVLTFLGPTRLAESAEGLNARLQDLEAAPHREGATAQSVDGARDRTVRSLAAFETECAIAVDAFANPRTPWDSLLNAVGVTQ